MIKRTGCMVTVMLIVTLVGSCLAVPSKLDQVIIQTPPTIGALPLFWMEATGLLKEVDLEIQISPDHQRGIALIAQNDIDLLVTGVNVGAKAYNKGIGLKLVNTNTWGIDYLLTGFSIESWADLTGKTLSVPLLGGPLDFLARYFLLGNGVDPESVEFVYLQSNQGARAFQLGQIDAIILPEPMVTITLNSYEQAVIAFDLQAEWAKIHDGENRIPFVGLFASVDFASRNPELIKTINQLYQEGIDWIIANPGEAALLAEKYFGQPAAAVEQSLTRVNINLFPDEARDLIEQYFNEILGLYPEMIGGKLPDEEFYLQ